MILDNILITNNKISKRVILKFFFIILLIIVGFDVLLSQNVGKISGTVKDSETGESIVGCNILILGTTMGASTDNEGSFFILNVPPGKYDVQASMIGYQKMIQKGVIINASKTSIVNFTITPSAILQKEVVVEAVRPDVEPEKTSTSAIVRFEEVQGIAGMRDVGDVLQLTAEITDGHFRGGRTGEEYYTLQGLGIVNPLNNTTAFLPIMSAVEEVEVITSGFGAQYGNAQSGVVNISMKEGKSDRWGTRIESRMRAPGRKHFGPSVFDPEGNPYLKLLLDKNTWLQGDPETNTPYFASMGSGLKDMYGGDTVVLLQVAQTLWQMQMKRDMFREYGDDIDYSVETTTGGPLNDKMRMFLALRRDIDYPKFPTEQPNIQRQIMGNIANDLGSSSTLRLSGGYSENNTNVFPSSNSLGYYSWLWDRILTINYQKTTNLQLGIRFTHAFNQNTYYELKLNSLLTRRKVGSTPSPSSVPDSLIINERNQQVDWDKMIPQTVKSPDEFYYLRGDDIFRDELSRTISLEASLTSQITKSHLLNTGLQFNSYLIDVKNNLGVREGSGGPIEIYKNRPFELALYGQDKMEFEGMIANVGLRFDLWSPNKNYYTNLFTPFRVLDTAGHTSNDPAAASQEKTPILGRLQPRMGISFPVTTNTVFHLNYGSFMQRPSFQYIVSTRVKQGSLAPQRLGNPRLKPEMTNSYDVGIMQGLGEGFTLDVSGYYKDVKNLVETAIYSSDGSYETYFNRDYADIRGFRVSLSKKRGDLFGSINYQFSVATGKSATTSNAPVSFVLDPTTNEIITKLDKVPIRDILLDFDRTHNLIINIGYKTGERWGLQMFKVYPLSDITISANSFARSGRPYTSSFNKKLINGARTPAEYNTNIKLTKKLINLLGMDATLYFEIFNLFNQKILNYDYIFSTPNAGSTNNRIEYYENYPIDDPNNGILYWQDTNLRSKAFAVDQSFLIYSNSPRSYYFGFILEL